MNERHNKIIVHRRYEGKLRDYREEIRLFFQQVYAAGPGRGPFFQQEIRPALESHAKKLFYDDGTHFVPQLDSLESDVKQITNFVGKNYSSKKEFVFLLPILDAFLQIRYPGFGKTFKTQNTADEVGMVLAEYLRDSEFQNNRYELAKAKQRIMGIYTYSEMDTYSATTGQERFFALLSVDASDYVLAVDGPLSHQPNKTTPLSEKADILTGFCVPGDEFSVIVLRTACLHYRQLGLLYTSGNLIDQTGSFLNDITYEIFTTDKSAIGSNNSGAGYGSKNIDRALDIYFGPKIRRELSLTRNHREKASISKKIANIRFNML